MQYQPAMRELRCLGGQDVNREPTFHHVYVKDGTVFDYLHDFPFKVEATGDEFMGWGRLDGPVYRLVSEHYTLETNEAELKRIGVL